MKYGTVIVTGGSGFIGSHLVDRLVEQAKRVVVIDKVRPPRKIKNKKAVYKKIDIRDSDVVAIFKKEKPDVVFHLAAHIFDRESVENPVQNAQDNILGSLNIFEGMRGHGNGKIIFTSTGVTYGAQSQLPISESMVPSPTTPYAVSKLTGERYLHFYKEVHGVPFTALRLGNVYGPRQDSSAESGAIGIFTAKLLQGETPFINNDGKTTRDYIYVDDVIEALLAAADSDYVGVLNIGTGIETTTQELFELVRAEVGVQSFPDTNEEVQDMLKRVALKNAKAKEVLGWAPAVPLSEGVANTVAWYRENL
ncbi:NAD-dependent epimerase/dehydratase family protein [Candidatus Uhrbacteria bacterium]|nr:NAD-dependent epimerase/dehydratase family protein [Candidatus Uhrbacteria bacterium]